jgi:sterol desaturase/sphingolipid hydroxylase (fatty acid hydroxylase superfamily)
MEMLAAIGRQFLLFTALLAPLELLFPARRNQRLIRAGWLTDLLHFTLNPFLISLGGALLLSLFAALIPPLELLRRQPWALQFAEIFVVSELLTYWVHRLSHEVPWLWRFHAVHHSNSELDFLAAHRQHPLEAIWLVGVANLPVVALGFDVEPILGFVLAQKIYTAFLHANLRVGFGPLTRLLASPRFHHWHHDTQLRGNYASALTVWDTLFGSYRLPSGFPSQYGCDEPVATGWWGQLLHPLAARRHHPLAAHLPARAPARPAPSAHAPSRAAGSL